MPERRSNHPNPEPLRDIVPRVLATLFALPSGRTVKLCAECLEELPGHQYFCSAVRDYSPEQILREMASIHMEVAKLERAADALRKLPASSGHRAAKEIDLEIEVTKQPYWEWPRWLGFDVWSATAEQCATIEGAVRALIDGPLMARSSVPPWKRRRGAT